MAPSHDGYQETQPRQRRTQPPATTAAASHGETHQRTQPPATPAVASHGESHPRTQQPATPAAASHGETHQRTQPPAAGFRLPVGYCFEPTDCELIREYLMKKVNNEPIDVPIQDTYLRKKNPKDLAAEFPKIGKNDWYFFTPRDRKYPNGARPDRAADSGYWKATGNDKPVVFEGRGIGSKRSLVFYRGKAMQGERTNWIMHEFTLKQPPRQKTTPDDMRLDDWVLCRIHEKPEPKTKRKRKSRTVAAVDGVSADGVAADVTTNNNLEHQDNNLDHHHNLAQPPIDHTTAPAPGQYYSGYPGQYYSGYEQQQPMHHNFNNNTASANSGFGYGSSYGDLVPSHVNPNSVTGFQTAAPVTGFEEPIMSSPSTWNDEDFLDSSFLDSSFSNSNRNTMAASWNNEAYYFAYDQCPAAAAPPQPPPPPPLPPNINNNYGKRS